jgi:hypothetical protein
MKVYRYFFMLYAALIFIFVVMPLLTKFTDIRRASGVLDKFSRTNPLYFYAVGSDTQWTNLANWYKNLSRKTNATSLPTSSSKVTLLSSCAANLDSSSWVTPKSIYLEKDVTLTLTSTAATPPAFSCSVYGERSARLIANNVALRP